MNENEFSSAGERGGMWLNMEGGVGWWMVAATAASCKLSSFPLPTTSDQPSGDCVACRGVLLPWPCSGEVVVQGGSAPSPLTHG